MPGEGRTDGGRISVNLRVGATGHRWIDESDEALATLVRDTLEALRSACTVSTTTATEVGLTVVSSLADGADRIIADAALSMGAHLEVVLPLPLEDYVSDFADAESRRRFRELLDRASSVTTVRGAQTRPDAYSAAGETVVLRSDVILAIWDGLPPRGSGGTAEVVDAAGEAGKPVAWIEVSHPEGSHAPPPPVLKQMPRTIVVLSAKAFASLDWFNSQRVFIAAAEIPPDGFPRSGEVSDFVLPFYLRADRIAQHRQVLFRWASTVLYVLSAIAIIAPATQLVYLGEEGRSLTFVELGALLIIIGILLLGRHTLLLERWLGARFFAERLRSLAFLAELSVEQTLETIPTEEEAHDNPLDGWIRRAMSELWIRCPRPAVDITVLFHTFRTRLYEEWLSSQVGYHTGAQARAHRRHQQFKAASVSLFSLSVAAAAVHLGGVHTPGHAAIYIALVVPTVAAALSGFAAQRDYPRVAIRSRAMARSLTEAMTDVQSATTVEQLRTVAQRVDIMMQGESVDWYAAARLRAPEVP